MKRLFQFGQVTQGNQLVLYDKARVLRHNVKDSTT